MSHHATGPQNDPSETTSRSSTSEKDLKVPPRTDNDLELVTSKGNVVTKNGAVFSTEESSTSLSSNIFKDPEVKEYFVDLYEKAQYECRHVFDADAEWSEEEEKAVIRKLDWKGQCYNPS